MENKALVHCEKYGLTWDMLRALPREHFAAISVLAYAASEVNALQRIFLSQDHALSNEKSIDSATNIQKFVIFRSWSSKIFEIEQFMHFCGKKRETKNRVLLDLAADARRDFSALRDREGYDVAKIIRHEAANHYSFKAALKNLDSVPAGMDCNLYTHAAGGNDFFPMGEAVMFHARLGRKWANSSAPGENQKRFEEWMYWNLDATRWLHKTNANFMERLVFKAFDDYKFSKEVYWVPEEFVGHCPDRKTPVFSRKEL